VRHGNRGGILACPGCLTLIHSEQLKRLGQQAGDASRVADRDAELTAWNRALTLLPVGSRQHATVSRKIAALSSSIEPTPTPQPQSRVWKWIVGLGPAGVFLWKMKFLAVALLTNGKVLLLGLTKASTFFSMLLAFGVYWTAWGMWFALGLVLSIYVHEMGHVVALRRYGIAATAMPHSASPGSPLVTGCSPCWRSLPRYVRSIQPYLTSPTSACGWSSCC
jgi:hypothetical protein